MGKKLETIQIEHGDSFITINLCDFDESKHKKYKVQKKKEQVDKDLPEQPKILINTASLTELTEIKGVGKTTAVKIEQSRPYNSFPELTSKIPGVDWMAIADQLDFTL